MPWPTWVSNKWNVPTKSLLNAKDLGTVPSDDIVLFRIDRIPDWLDQEIEFLLEGREGNYGTIKARFMKEHVVEVQK